jgi:magnesium transporter
MRKFLQAKAKKAGASPGSLLPPEQAPPEPARLTLRSYSPEGVSELQAIGPDAAKEALSKPGNHWLDLAGTHDVDMIKRLGSTLNIHPLVLEDMVSSGNRAKLEDHDDFIFVIMAYAHMAPDSLAINQISLLVGQNYVITSHHGLENLDSLEAVRRRLDSGKGRIRKMGADYLAYALIDAMVDDYFVVLGSLADDLENLDELVAENQAMDVLPKLHELRRQLIELRRTIWPVRDMLLRLSRLDSSLISDASAIYVRDAYDHVIEVCDLIDSFRDLATSIQDTYHSLAAQHLNKVMKVLTLVATIFIPLTFIAGIYGMNFEWMPELKFKYGYFSVLGLMLALFIGMVIYFKKKKWL